MSYAALQRESVVVLVVPRTGRSLWAARQAGADDGAQIVGGGCYCVLMAV